MCVIPAINRRAISSRPLPGLVEKQQCPTLLRKAYRAEQKKGRQDGDLQLKPHLRNRLPHDHKICKPRADWADANLSCVFRRNEQAKIGQRGFRLDLSLVPAAGVYYLAKLYEFAIRSNCPEDKNLSGWRFFELMEANP